jgi:hypothetical protein
MSRDVEAEARALKARFEVVRNRAAFARDFKVPGGQAMIYQHIKGLKPISMAAAVAYMRGFQCSLADISPALAEEAAQHAEAAAPTKREPAKAAHEPQSQVYSIHNHHVQAIATMMEGATEEQQAQCVGAVALVLGCRPPTVKNLRRRTGT